MAVVSVAGRTKALGSACTRVGVVGLGAGLRVGVGAGVSADVGVDAGAAVGLVRMVRMSRMLDLSPRKLHPLLRTERAEKDRFATGQKNYFFRCWMNVNLDVVK